jgi:NAD(P)H-hydrate epimerase
MFLTREQCRALDRHAMEVIGVPGVVLMENAGHNMADWVLAQRLEGPVVVCCGRGNNGGDGFVIARHLDNACVAVRVLLFARPEDVTGDAAVNWRLLAHTGAEVLALPDPDDEALRRELAGAAWVVDALVGTGQQGPLRPPLDRVAAAINGAGARVVAVDIPSGLDCDTGEPQGTTVKADDTLTVAALKKGFAAPAAEPFLGRVQIVDMGLPRKAWSVVRG